MYVSDVCVRVCTHMYVRTRAQGGNLQTTRQHSLVLQHIHLDTTLREGNPVTLQVCLQDRRPLQERKATKFQSNQIYPVELTVQGEAQQVLVVGSMNNWRPERVGSSGAGFCQQGSTGASFRSSCKYSSSFRTACIDQSVLFW